MSVYYFEHFDSRGRDWGAYALTAGLCLCVLAAALFVPWCVLWALRTLLQVELAYTFKTWLACTVLLACFGRGGSGLPGRR